MDASGERPARKQVQKPPGPARDYSAEAKAGKYNIWTHKKVGRREQEGVKRSETCVNVSLDSGRRVAACQENPSPPSAAFPVGAPLAIMVGQAIANRSCTLTWPEFLGLHAQDTGQCGQRAHLYALCQRLLQPGCLL